MKSEPYCFDDQQNVSNLRLLSIVYIFLLSTKHAEFTCLYFQQLQFLHLPTVNVHSCSSTENVVSFEIASEPWIRLKLLDSKKIKLFSIQKKNVRKIFATDSGAQIGAIFSSMRNVLLLWVKFGFFPLNVCTSLFSWFDWVTVYSLRWEMPFFCIMPKISIQFPFVRFGIG